MKFGQTFAHSLIHEWSEYYLPYRALKHTIEVELKHKSIAPQKVESLPQNLLGIGLFEALIKDRIEKMSGFARTKLSTQEDAIFNCLKSEKELGCARDISSAIPEIAQTAQDIIVELQLLVRFLVQNSTALSKILKKYKKKCGTDLSQRLFDIDVFNPSFMEEIDNKIDETKKLKDRVLRCAESPASGKGSLVIEICEENIRSILEFIESNMSKNVPKEEYSGILAERLKSKDHNLPLCLLISLAKNVNRIVEFIIAHFPEVVCIPLCNSLSRGTILHKIVKDCCNSERSDAAGSKDTQDALRKLEYILSNIPIDIARKAIMSKDSSMRTPLHIAVVRYSVEAAKLMISKLPKGCMSGAEWEDSNKHVATFHAVVYNRYEIVEYFVKSKVWENLNLFSSPFNTMSASRLSCSKEYLNNHNTRHMGLSPLALSSYMGYSGIVLILLENGANPNIKTTFSETPLHYCCRRGNLNCLNLLLSNNKNGVPYADVHIRETIKGRTPLFYAVINGKIEYVKRLLEVGSKADITDYSNLNAYEHAVFRAHYDIANFLSAYTASYPIQPDVTFISKNAQATNFGHLNRSMPPPKCRIVTITFVVENKSGNRVIRLSGKDAECIVGEFVIEIRSTATTPKVAKITVHSSDMVEVVSFEVPEGMKELYLDFTITSPMTTSETGYATMDIVTIGTSSVLLSLETSDAHYEKTRGVSKVPIISSEGRYVGSVNFKYLVINTFAAPLLRNDITTPWMNDGLKLIGHRGSGMDKPVKDSSAARRFHLSENTLLSFVTAGNMGANYVEFDVQVTNDRVPVIYHDFRISETLGRPEINSISEKEFISFGPSPETRYRRGLNEHTCIHHRISQLRRSKSTSSLITDTRYIRPDMLSVQKLVEINMNTTVSKQQLPKIDLPFVTMRKAFDGVPLKTGFNIEVKYPNPKQCSFNGFNPMELNEFVDSILKVVAECAGARKICFSSFNSEVCTVLCTKQNIYPVFYLTDAGTTMLPDTHDTSLYSAVRFAIEAGCVGLVCRTTPLLAAPRLIHVVREKGLVLMAYGPGSEELDKAKILKNYGIDGIITDRVPDLYNSFNQ